MIKGVHHIGIVVTNIEEAIRLYTEAFGFHLTQPVTMISELGIKDAVVSTGEVALEIMESVATDKPIGKFLEKHGEGLHHISLNVDDINETLKSLAQKGLSLVNKEAIPFGEVLVATIHPRSTRGVMIELIQTAKTDEH
jgi:methylmalonyl-CoA epimerase